LAIAPSVELVVFALVGFLGGAHCLGMCGPLVTVYTDRFRDPGPVSFYELRQHLLYNAGRVTGYTAVGALMGVLGAVMYDGAAIANAANGIRAIAGLVAGIAIIATGASYLTGGAGGPLTRLAGGGQLTGRLLGTVGSWARRPRIVGLGAVHALLPCPLLYPAYLYTLARGDPVEGAIALAVLGLATVPALLLQGVVLGATPQPLLRRVHRGLGAAFLVLGYLPLSHGLALLGVPVPLPPVHDLIYQPLDVLVDAAEYCLPA
jgi:hypothetical protein